MGQFLTAKCRECDFLREKIAFGGGRWNYQTNKPVPAINKQTGEFIVCNYYEKEQLKDTVAFYNERQMHKGEEDTSGHRFSDVVIKHENNKCPKCGNFTLDFIGTGLFD